MENTLFNIREVYHLSDEIARREIVQMMHMIKDAQSLNQINEDIEKTPASVTKYSSKTYGAPKGIQINSTEFTTNKEDLKNGIQELV